MNTATQTTKTEAAKAEAALIAHIERFGTRFSSLHNAEHNAWGNEKMTATVALRSGFYNVTAAVGAAAERFDLPVFYTPRRVAR